ncbi:MAG: TonB-dependent receptor, partial [Desulfobacteraceae bacterium]|nr:TonB-dependent receptor [Desulfobacteraceae bacterium]
ALVEGWTSVNTDPSNYSAHRFLADTYATLPRHEVARVSELLQSQLLQPINITPLQPGLAESNLYLISAGGAADLSFREFNPLFNRDRVALQATGLYGENENELPDNDTWAGEGIVSGIYKKASFSAGYARYETNGWRPNADQEDEIANIFAQLELTDKTSVQAEYRYRKNNRGETQLRFEPDDFRPNFRNEDETDTIRAGFRHAFSPPHTLIGNFTYQDADRKQRDEPDPIFRLFDRKITEESYGGELQYLFRSKSINIVGGAGHFDTDSQHVLFTELFFPTPPFPPPPIGPGLVQTTRTLNRSVDHTNVYLYSYINYPENVTWTIGGSGDFFEGAAEETPDVDQFNPKFGVIWNPVPNTTLRGAIFRVLKRTLLTDQTLEPTQVAGFNQFFDDINATDAWRYGGAIDQKFSKSLYGGAEYARRDLDSVFFNDTAGKLREVKWDEKLFRAYLHWTPHKWLGLSGEYLYERFERDERFALGAKEVKTHYVPLGINFFHPSGLSVWVTSNLCESERNFFAGINGSNL